MFTPESRTQLKDALVEAARADPEVTAAAVVGSGATGTEDDWSDIDLALRLAPGADQAAAVERWTTTMRGHGAVDTLDIHWQRTVYRVFLLDSSLQVDLSFWPDEDFRGTQAGFEVLFGEANPPTTQPAADPDRLAGTGWLYALHARSAIARGRTWQAVLMLDGVRDQVVALLCIRHGLPSYEGRGVDRLPPAVLADLAAARASSVGAAELHRSLGALLDLLHAELPPERTARLSDVLRILAS